MLTGRVVEIPDGSRGLDLDSPLDAARCSDFLKAGYTFVFRYIRRFQSHPYDLTSIEASIIVRSGLGLAIVQHVESDSSWVPSGVKGISNGATAAREMANVGMPPGSMVWCDLEGVAPGTNPASVIDYVNQWATEVLRAGYVPALYVGFRCGLTSTLLYHSLKVAHYWAAFNLNSDEFPAVRGVCMRQHVAKAGDIPPGMSIKFDVDVAGVDAKGGRATALYLTGSV